MLKRELFKQMLIRESYQAPVMDEYDYLTKQAATPMTEQTKSIVMNSLPLVTAGLITLGAATGINKLVNVKNKREEKRNIDTGFKEILELYPNLATKGVDQKRLRRAYDAYMEYAPSTSKHPMIVGQFLNDYGAEIGVNSSVLKDLAALEKNKADVEKSRGTSLVKTDFNPVPQMAGMMQLLQAQNEAN